MLITAAEYARRNGKTVNAILMRCINGSLKTATRDYGQWMVDEDETLVDKRRKDNIDINVLVEIGRLYHELQFIVEGKDSPPSPAAASIPVSGLLKMVNKAMQVGLLTNDLAEKVNKITSLFNPEELSARIYSQTEQNAWLMGYCSYSHNKD